MTRDEILHKLKLAGFEKEIDFDSPIRALVNILTEVPEFKFALREDLKEDKRFLPIRAEPKASGWDVKAAMKDRKPLIIRPFEYVKISLGFRAFCPEGWWYELRPRSSTFAKKYLNCLYGVIDQTFENELVLACQYIPEVSFETETICENLSYSSESRFNSTTQVSAPNLEINFGDAIGQIIPIRRQEMVVSECSNIEYNEYCKNRGGVRKEGGFGSTDSSQYNNK